ncbi:thioredoxin-like protein CITRX, chloroplastic isoform X2 [Vigna angularis]|uniref:thioredoxin-like protein CITRX, chloroplastic isoform X2 n=1 Tax=Phaseolus angularis TaxID=3914 RepID=UPI0022B328A7|nr:thioredoxin-like protein CITRX, chloroplastic isoform X2 [Vigna angularis]
MVLFQCHAPHHSMAILSPFNSKPLCASLPNPSFTAHHHPYPLTTTTHLNNNKPLSLSTVPRKLLCKPPQGKYIRDDYLVKKLSAEEIQELVKGERKVPLIIDFYATWCGPCILMAQELEMSATVIFGATSKFLGTTLLQFLPHCSALSRIATKLQLLPQLQF